MHEQNKDNPLFKAYAGLKAEPPAAPSAEASVGVGPKAPTASSGSTAPEVHTSPKA